MPAKNSEAIFWRLRFTWPLRAGKRANANFARPEGSFAFGVPRCLPGLAVLARPAAVWPDGFRVRCPGVFLPVFRCLVPRLRAGRCFLFGLRCRGLLAVCPPSALFPVCGPHFLPLLSWLLRPVPVCLFCAVCAGFSFLFFAFSCLTFASQTSFHLSLMPRRAPHFLFGKKMGEKNREGSGAPLPFEPHSSALRPISPFPALLAGLRGLRPQTAG